jgi:hypothetical protein
MRLLGLLLDWRVVVQLLRRHLQQVSTWHRSFPDRVGRDVQESGRWEILCNVLSRLLWSDLLRLLSMRTQRGCDAALSPAALAVCDLVLRRRIERVYVHHLQAAIGRRVSRPDGAVCDAGATR